MKTTKEMLEVMQAYEEGKEIESTPFGGNYWIPCSDPSWSWGDYDYRIKTEPKEPTYRPYESVDEMVADYERRFEPKPYSQRPMHTLPLIAVQSKNKYYKYLITAFGEPNKSVFAASCWESLADLFSNCVYLDGSPCGKLVEE